MSFCVNEGKDKILFISQDDLNKNDLTDGLAELSKPPPDPFDLEDETEGAGLILPNGEVNWQCPCLGGLAVGPCSMEFREAFSCFHYSKSELKGSECGDQFKRMHDCMGNYPSLYENFTKLPSEDGDENGTDKVGDAAAAVAQSENKNAK